MGHRTNDDGKDGDHSKSKFLPSPQRKGNEIRPKIDGGYDGDGDGDGDGTGMGMGMGWQYLGERWEIFRFIAQTSPLKSIKSSKGHGHIDNQMICQNILDSVHIFLIVPRIIMATWNNHSER